MSMWEILVPTIHNSGRPHRLRYHRVWDAKVRKISGGLTIMPPVIGQWMAPLDEKLFKERMIPVRIIATEQQIHEIIDMTLVYYAQKAVLAYQISDNVIMKYAVTK